ncbi:MAG: TolC family protein [Sphingobacteriales bacterium]
MKFIITILFFFIINVIPGQDSLKTLTEKQVMEIVKQFHPVAKQADINIEKAKADITTARGMFDPLLSTQISNKTFNGTEYYNHFQPEIVIPTWYGIEINAGLENLSGSRTDPQETLGKTSFVGITVPLAKNLLMDKRRAALQQAKFFKQLSEVERRTVLNDLILDAMKSYWHWVQQYQVMKVIEDAVKVNVKRFELLKIAFRQGERPAIDTVEALAQLQNFKLMLNEAQLNFQNAGLELSVFLWNKNTEPVILTATVTPDAAWKKISVTESSLPVLEDLLNNARNNHPDLLQYDFKLNILRVEKKLKFQELLPAINFRYNQLGKGYDIIKNTTAPLFENNYQYGISLAIPLRLSEGRGEYRKAKLKIKEAELYRSQKTLLVENKVRTYYNELMALQNQVALQQQQYNNYLTLQRGEETRLFNGESSLFLVNSRENKTLEALQKLTELETKYFKTLNSLYWASGILV